MAGRTLINGTGYQIKGGLTLVNGTGYAIKKGRTLVNGTGYDISFQRYKLQYPPQLNVTSGRFNPTYSLENDVLTLDTGVNGACPTPNEWCAMYSYLLNMDGSIAVLHAGDVIRYKFDNLREEFYEDGGLTLWSSNMATNLNLVCGDIGGTWTFNDTYTITQDTVVRFEATRHTEERCRDGSCWTNGWEASIRCMVKIYYFEVNGTAAFGHL